MAERANARDPVRVAMLIGVLIMLGVAVYGVLVSSEAGERKAEAAQLQKRWDGLNAKQNSGTVRALRIFAEELLAVHQRRVLFAPQIAHIKEIVPESVFLTRANLRLISETTVSAPPASAVAEAGKKPATPRSVTVERLVLRLEGMAGGSRPEIEVDRFLDTLRTLPVLSNDVKEVSLRSISRAAMGASSAAVGAQFTIECLFKENK